MKQWKSIGAMTVGTVTTIALAGGGGNGTFRWTDAVSSFWQNTTRWSLVSGSGNPPPGVGDTARFDLNAFYEITIPGGQTTSVDAIRCFAGDVVIQSSSVFADADLHLTTGQASISVEQGGEIRFGDSAEPVHVVVGSQTNLYNNSTLLIRYASSFQTPILALGNQAFPSTGSNIMTVGNSNQVAVLNVTNQAQIGRHGDLGRLTLQQGAQGTFGGSSFIGGSITSPGSDGELLILSGADLLANSALTIGGGHETSSGLVRVEGNGSTVTMNGASNLTIGGTASQGDGDITIDFNGTFTTGTGLTRVRPSGRVRVGASNNSGQFIVNGAFEVDGGDLAVYPSNGLAMPTGATVPVMNDGYALFVDPYSIDGGRTFNVMSGSTLELLAGGAIGANGSEGNVLISGGFFWTNGPLELGASGGAGTLTIDSSSADIGPVLYLGVSATTGSTGTMTIEGGSSVESNVTNCWAMAPRTTSTLTVTGFETELLINASQIAVGHPDAQGASVIQILDQALLETTQGVGQGGVARCWPGGLFYVGNNAEWRANSEVIVQGGELRIDGELTVLPNAWLELQQGIISGDGVIRVGSALSPIVVSHGTIAPGTSAGSLSFEGDVLELNSDSTLAIELGGLAPGSQHDQLRMFNGAIELGGTLDVSLIDGFAPSPGDTFVIVTAEEAIAGTFGVVITPTPMDVEYDTNEVRLVTLASCAGDLVQTATLQPPPDGIVDGADLAFLIGDWGANPGSPADIVTSATLQPPPDGVVNGADLAVLIGAWGVCD